MEIPFKGNDIWLIKTIFKYIEFNTFHTNKDQNISGEEKYMLEIREAFIKKNHFLIDIRQ